MYITPWFLCILREKGSVRQPWGRNSERSPLKKIEKLRALRHLMKIYPHLSSCESLPSLLELFVSMRYNNHEINKYLGKIVWFCIVCECFSSHNWYKSSAHNIETAVIKIYLIAFECYLVLIKHIFQKI